MKGGCQCIINCIKDMISLERCFLGPLSWKNWSSRATKSDLDSAGKALVAATSGIFGSNDIRSFQVSYLSRAELLYA